MCVSEREREREKEREKLKERERKTERAMARERQRTRERREERKEFQKKTPPPLKRHRQDPPIILRNSNTIRFSCAPNISSKGAFVFWQSFDCHALLRHFNCQKKKIEFNVPL